MTEHRCPECMKPIDQRALTCPYCGAPIEPLNPERPQDPNNQAAQGARSE